MAARGAVGDRLRAIGGPLFALGYGTLGGNREPPGLALLAPGPAAFGGLYDWSGFFHGANETKLAVLAGAAVGFFVLLVRTLAGALMTLATAIVGPLVEIALVRAGAFVHLQADYLGVPVWLPALYACAGSVVGHGARRWLASSSGCDRAECRRAEERLGGAGVSPAQDEACGAGSAAETAAPPVGSMAANPGSA